MLIHFLPPMVKRGKGEYSTWLLFIPYLATYVATKAYVLSLSESLEEELSGIGVSLTALRPSVTDIKMVADAQKKVVDSIFLSSLPESLSKLLLRVIGLIERRSDLRTRGRELGRNYNRTSHAKMVITSYLWLNTVTVAIDSKPNHKNR